MLGDYRIEGIVGVGRMGVVYLAIDRITGRAVALKVLREDVGIDPVYRERFRREGELLAALDHPHIIPIYGMGEIDGELYIATRLVSGTLQGPDRHDADRRGRGDEGARRASPRRSTPRTRSASCTATSSPPTC